MGYNSEILLESGTNELEIVECKVGDIFLGINVAKVKEIIKYSPITKIPNGHPCIHGLFMPRKEVITVINLPKYLNSENHQSIHKNFFLITYFNKTTVAFQVNSILGIRRLSWDEIETPNDNINDGMEGIITGIVKGNDHLILLIDFEKILTDISPTSGIQISNIKNMGSRMKNDNLILIAEDSKMLSNMINECLKEAGYTNIIRVSNGEKAWEILQESKNNGKQKISCVITDIEMPKMDGHHLTKLIKRDKILCKLPVILFSSLISDAMIEKGKKLGADAQIAKPEIEKLVGIIDRLTRQYLT